MALFFSRLKANQPNKFCKRQILLIDSNYCKKYWL